MTNKVNYYSNILKDISKEYKEIYIDIIETPIGKMLGACNNEGVFLLEFMNNKEINNFINIVKNLNIKIINTKNNILDLLNKEIQQYFNLKLKIFSVPLSIYGTKFQKEVWKELQNIKYGTTCSYKEEAVNLNKPHSFRAVANANGKNRIAIIIPCHRVIASNGGIGGYGGGIKIKKYLINLESKFNK